MKDYKKITNIDIKINRDTAFRFIDCYPNSSIYEEVIEEYLVLESMVYEQIEPTAYIKFDTLPSHLRIEGVQEGTPIAYVIVTLGDKIEELIEQQFKQEKYLTGTLTNAMADTYLFQLDDSLGGILKETFALKRLGVEKRIEAPASIPMSVQRDILEAIKTEEDIPIDVTSGFMFTTIKTMGYILVLTEDETIYRTQCDCSICSQEDCKIRKNPRLQESDETYTMLQRNSTIKPNITIIGRGIPLTFEYEEKESLMDAMLAHGIYLSAACGGRGTCGKCKLQILEGDMDISLSDRAKLTEEELSMGYRLSCKAYPKGDCTVKLVVGDETDFEVVTNHDQGIFEEYHFEEDCAIAIDIGTTTLAVSLLGLESKNVLYTHTAINKQRAYGADVISRMKASNDGKKEQLKESIQKDLLEGIHKVMETVNLPEHHLKKIVIAGNTTMGHLLLGYSCQTLGVYPFTPVDISTILLPFEEVFGTKDFIVPVVFLPGVSTYVGGDIVAGLLTCDFDKKEKPCLLIDLGTNGEMAIGNKEKILVSSTAAGPAFEGGNISCGVGSIAGAICNIDFIKGKSEIQTIGQKPPIGICGTGVIEMTSELVKTGIVDETGLLLEEYFDNGYEVTTDAQANPIKFTQKDIREIQLAKAAIRAGAETLILRYGINYEDLDTVYLAGGFGYKINLEKALHIGLLPKELSYKIVAIGNSALGGAINYLLEEEAPNRAERIVQISSEINLANDQDFNELYLEHMFFDTPISKLGI